MMIYLATSEYILKGRNAEAAEIAGGNRCPVFRELKRPSKGPSSDWRRNAKTAVFPRSTMRTGHQPRDAARPCGAGHDVLHP